METPVLESVVMVQGLSSDDERELLQLGAQVVHTLASSIEEEWDVYPEEASVWVDLLEKWKGIMRPTERRPHRDQLITALETFRTKLDSKL